MSVRSVLVSVVLFLFTVTVAKANLVASTPGEFSVSSSGSASYSVPIVVPPGTAGVEPKLSLNYSSQGRNGLLGVGWMIGGLSVIHRCPTNLVKDGFIDGIDFDSNDRFCLDGQPLIAINGTYGASGTEYRTEINNFSKVISYGSTGNGPSYFKVWTKSGEIMEYGNTTNSLINPPLANGTTQPDAICWLLNKVTDTVGNYMTVTYFEDTSTGENYPERIDYTGNASASLSPSNSVEFTYETRTDSGTRYLAGLKMESTKRLKKITSKDGANKVREYTFSFDYNAITGRSHIVSLSECDATSTCISPTTFVWNTLSDTFVESTNFNINQVTTAHDKLGHSSNTSGTYLGDYNGDGLTDILRWHDTHTYNAVFLSDGDGSFTESSNFNLNTSSSDRIGHSNGTVGALVSDFNGDGLSDILRWKDNNLDNALYISNGDGSFTESTNFNINQVTTAHDRLGHSTGTSASSLGDFNGDGLVDILRWHDTHTYNAVFLSNGDGSFTESSNFNLDVSSSDRLGHSNGTVGSSVADFNGDGLADILRWRDSNLDNELYISNGDGSFTVSPNFNINQVTSAHDRLGHSSGTSGTFLGDFNGDGLTDIVRWHNTTSYNTLFFSTGDGSFTETSNFNIGGSGGSGYYARLAYSSNSVGSYLGDFNGDGLTDILRWANTYQNNDLYYSNGDGSFTESTGFNLSSSSSYRLGYSSNSVASSIGDFDGDGLADILRRRDSNLDNALYLSSVTHKTRSVNEITNGLGISIEIDYTPITDNTIYTKGSGATFPEVDIQAPMYVVSESRTDNGIGGQNTLSYEYQGAKVHVQGRGLLGFASRTVTDVDTNIVIETNYKQEFPFIGQVASTKTTVDGTLVSEELNTFASLPVNPSNGPAFPYVTPGVSKSYDINGGALLSTVTTTSAYDSYGNPTNIAVTTNDVGIDTYTTTTANTYTNDTSKWHLGRLTQATVTKTGGAQTSPSRTSTFGYNSTTGLLNMETIESGADALVKNYSHDAYGNRISVTESGNGIVTRATSTTYDSKGQFPTTVTNALGQSETREYNDPYGNVTKLTGPNVLATTWEYDSLGRKSREVRADGTETNISYAFCTSGCPSQVNGLASYKITTTSTGAATSIAYYDAVNRVILTEAQSFDGSSVFVETEYDDQGRVDRKSNPYFGTSTPYWTDYTYDDLGRVTQQSSPTTGTTTMSYNGFVASSTNDLNQTSTEKKNSLGQTIWTKDNNDKQLDFEYDAQGNLITVTDSEGNVTSNSYNLRGFKTQMIDPDMGTWTYNYNVLGELTSQTDNKNQTVSMTYDTLGRLVTRTEPEGTTTWTYDTASKGKGKLASVSHYGGYSRSHTYDSLGRPSSTTTVTGGTSYTTSSTYDAFGRVDDVSYPGTSNFKVDHVYNTRGYLEKVRNANNTSEVFYTALAADQFGNITSQTLGSGAAAITTFRSFQQNSGRIQHIDSVVQDLEYTFNSIGNLTQRKDHDQSALTENFTYDNLNRLKTAAVVGAGTTSFTYDDLGNITYKSDVGNYTYGAGSAGPHAVTSTTGVLNNTYTYDANGNQISGDNKTLTWSSYNKPTQIQKGSSQSNFTYWPDRARYLQVTTASSVTTTTTTTYIGGLYEKVEKPGSTEQKHFIRAGSQTIAIYTDRNGTSNDKTEYLHRDHLGYIDTITDENGAIVEKLSFDAFGKRRLSTWNNGVPSIVSNNTRGFTGHEMLDAVGLIHMNGRVYDPLLGRFMSADPTLQYPSDMQNYNRYSYVHNNPLSLTDPSGFGFFKSAFKRFYKLLPGVNRRLLEKNPELAAIAAVVAAFFTGGAALSAFGTVTAAGTYTAGSYAIAGAAGGFAGGFVGSGGDLKAAVIGGLTGAAAGYIGGAGIFDSNTTILGVSAKRVVAHGVVGGAAAEAQGGKFGQGFLSSAFTKSFSEKIQGLTKSDPVAGGIAAAVVGGTASRLSGGKFQNGALTSAYQYLFNQVSREWAEGMEKLQKHARKAFSRIAGIFVSNCRASGVACTLTGGSGITTLTASQVEALQLTEGGLQLVGAVATGGFNAAVIKGLGGGLRSILKGASGGVTEGFTLGSLALNEYNPGDIILHVSVYAPVTPSSPTSSRYHRDVATVIIPTADRLPER